MMVDVLIVTIVFGYAGYAIYRGLKKSKKGACASCSMQKSCTIACANTPMESDHQTK